MLPGARGCYLTQREMHIIIQYYGFPITIGNNNILSLQVRCNNSPSPKGCDWVGELQYLNEHLDNCGFTLLPCPNECNRGDTVIQLFRRDLERHIREECPRRQYECPHCHEAGEYHERIDIHLQKCPMVEIPCQNNGCRVRMARRNLPMHFQECLFEIVPCRYATLGCMMKFRRRNLERHEKNVEEHLQLAVNTVQQLQSKLARAQSIHLPMRYEFTAYSAHKSANNEVHSPVFYTSPGGYKMCISVYANGIAEGHGTHVSVYASLMKGENDNHLPWPFTGKVTFELLNQLEDNNHYSKDITFPSNNKASQRVKNDEISSNALGLPCYVFHSALGFNRERNRQFLKDDCLYFRVSVDAQSSSRPWLI